MSYQKMMAAIAAGEIIVIDGATGTELERRGVPMHSKAWCAVATESHPAVVQAIHEDYIRAGAQVVTANTFSTTREVLEPASLGDKFETLNRQAVEVAVKARERVHTDTPVLVAGSISHTRQSMGWTPKFSDVAKFEADCTEMAAIHKAAGCDLILAEMMGHKDYSPCVIRAAKANDLPVWVGISARRQTDGSLGTYTDEHLPLADVLAPIVAAGGDVMGIMHSKADVILPALAMFKSHWSGPLLAYPDSINEDSDDLQLDKVIEDETFAKYCMSWREAGVQVLGGCCGLTVSHIAALTHRLAMSA